MQVYIDRDLFNEVKERLTMPEVLDHYGIEQNRAHFIHCPWHPDKTPSCKIRENSFHCYSCDRKGGIIEFVMMYKQCTNIEAAKELAVIAGIPVEDLRSLKPRPKPKPTVDNVSEWQLRKYLHEWQAETFKELKNALDEADAVLTSYTPGHEDKCFHATLNIKTELQHALDELATPTEEELIEFYERKGAELNEFIKIRKSRLQSGE